MAQDPYGYQETLPGNSAQGDASVALWCGLVALICGVAAPCTCYVTWFAALPLGAVALWYGIRARSGPPDPAAEAGATVGLVGGAVTVGFGLMWVLFILGYACLVIGMGVLGAMSGN
jgi:hypothetical protein